MTDREKSSDEYLTQLRDAVEASASDEADWPAFHSRLNAAIASRLSELRVRASLGHRATTAAGVAWWDYTARAAAAAVPIGLAAALLLFGFLRQGTGQARPPVVSAAAAGSSVAARAAFESVLTGVAAPQAVIAMLLPVPAAAFLGDSAGGSSR